MSIYIYREREREREGREREAEAVGAVGVAESQSRAHAPMYVASIDAHLKLYLEPMHLPLEPRKVVHNILCELTCNKLSSQPFEHHQVAAHLCMRP
jgi:hypothetical protein